MTMNGALPPSSSETTAIVSAAAARIFLPAATEPVSVTSCVMGLRTSASPSLPPAPVRTLTTPGGNPARSKIVASASAESGVVELGFTTMVLPAISAGATLRATIAEGKFHGVIPTQTP